MKIYRRDAFLNLPAGVLYCKGKPWYFEGISVKGDTLRWDGGSGDFTELGLSWVDAHDSGEAIRRLEEMLETGASYPMEKSYGRDGCFDSEDLFFVYEADDLRFLRETIDVALEHALNLQAIGPSTEGVPKAKTEGAE